VQIGLINNLRAGRSDKQVARILGLLDSYPNVLHVETDRAGALPDAIADLARRRIDLLVVNGGDGTLQHALTEILANEPFEKLPMIAPLRGGRTNMTALDLGAHRNPVKGLKAVLEAARAGRLNERTVHRPVLRIASDGGRRVQYGMFFGVGMIARAISLVHELFPPGRSQGSFGAGLVTMALVAKLSVRPHDGVLTPDKLQIRLDGEEVRSGEYYMSIATSLRRLFWGINPFWGRGPGGVRFTSIASDAKLWLRAAQGILRGVPRPVVNEENGYTSRNTERVELRLGCGFTIDGELFETHNDEVVTLSADHRVPFIRA
jgi:diacylglycerol kinase (ATP)